MRVAVYRFPCEMFRALPLAENDPPAEIVSDSSFSPQLFCHAAGAPCGKLWKCRGTFVCETEIPHRGLARHLARSKKGSRRR